MESTRVVFSAMDGLIGLHGPREFIEFHGFRALVVSPRVDLSGFRVRHAADLLNLTVGFRLDLVQVAHTIAAVLMNSSVSGD